MQYKEQLMLDPMLQVNAQVYTHLYSQNGKIMDMIFYCDCTLKGKTSGAFLISLYWYYNASIKSLLM